MLKGENFCPKLIQQREERREKEGGEKTREAERKRDMGEGGCISMFR